MVLVVDLNDRKFAGAGSHDWDLGRWRVNLDIVLHGGIGDRGHKKTMHPAPSLDSWVIELTNPLESLAIERLSHDLGENRIS